MAVCLQALGFVALVVVVEYYAYHLWILKGAYLMGKTENEMARKIAEALVLKLVQAAKEGRRVELNEEETFILGNAPWVRKMYLDIVMGSNGKTRA